MFNILVHLALAGFLAFAILTDNQLSKENRSNLWWNWWIIASIPLYAILILTKTNLATQTTWLATNLTFCIMSTNDSMIKIRNHAGFWIGLINVILAIVRVLQADLYKQLFSKDF